MKIYIVTKMEHSDDYKRPETDHAIIKIYRDKEKAYEFAHNEQFEYMRLYKHVADGENDEENDEDDDYDLPTYSRDEKDESWKVSYGKLIELFDDILPEPEFTMMASQTRYSVKEHTLE